MLALGHGSLFNHDSKKPNIVYTIDVSKLEIAFSTSYRKIEAGDELCIHYGRDLWFDEDTDENHHAASEDSHPQQEGPMPSFLQQMEM